MIASRRIAVVGSFTRDSVYLPDGSHYRGIGGSAAYIAAGALFERHESMVLSDVDNEMAETITSIGVFDASSICRRSDIVSPAFTITYDSNYQASYGSGLAVQQTDWPTIEPRIETIVGVDWIHVACRHPIPYQKVVRALLLDTASIFSLDGSISQIPRFDAVLRQALQRCSIYFANNEEWELLRGERLNEGVALAVVTNQGNPVRVFEYGKEVLRLEVTREAVRDPTGAGDVFSGAFLAALNRGNDLDVCAEAAISAASACVRTTGLAGFLGFVKGEGRN